jgi:hypothetical protein
MNERGCRVEAKLFTAKVIELASGDAAARLLAQPDRSESSSCAVMIVRRC